MVNKPDTNKARLRRHRRVRGKISGTAERPRLNVFRSSANIYAQVIDDVAGVTLCAASTVEKGFEGNGGNKEAARKVGKLIAERAQEKGGMADKDVMEDCGGALNFLRSQPGASGKVGVIGMCSGGRHTFLAACTLDGIDCAVDCWGGGVVCQPEQLTPQRPVQPLDYADKLSCPLLGIFGNDDWSPTREDVDILEARLKELGKDYEFHRYDGAAHGFWYYHRPMYRHEQAMDSLEKVLAFFQKHLK